MAVPYTAVTLKDRQEWLEHRKRGIGGSDAAAAIGLSRYRSPLDVWMDKTGRAEPKDLSDNDAVRWGTILEGPIADYFAERHPELKVRRRNATYVSKSATFMLANIDRLLTDKDGNKGILEVKTAGHYMDKDWQDGPPLEYYTQVSHYLAVTGFSFVWVAVLIGGRDYREYLIERDDGDITRLIELERKFWGFVEFDQMPEVTGMEDEGNALASLYSPDNGDIMPLDGLLKKAFADYQRALTEIKAFTKDKDLAASQIKALLGNSRGAENEYHRITWTRSERTTFHARRFQKEHPDLIEGYLTTRPYDGGLRVTEKGNR